MKSTRLLRRLAIVVAALLIFGVAGIPTVSAADTTHDISSGALVIGTSGNYTIIGSSTTGYNITVNNDVTATITLRSVSISSAASALNLQPGASVTLLLDGTSMLSGAAGAGIHVLIGSALVVNEASPGGTLLALGSNSCAGIGGCDGSGGGGKGDCGSVTILGGTVTAKGGPKGAGIGGGSSGTGGTVSILGGTVTANGGSNAAGIGGGTLDDGGTVNIYGGTVNATGLYKGAGIGGGDCGGSGAVNIYGGTVTATGGADAAGIGGGYGGDGGITNISGGTVTATGGKFGAGIGGGYDGDGGKIFISGLNTHVTAKGGEYSNVIGRGYSLGTDYPDGGTLLVMGGAHLTLLNGINPNNHPPVVVLEDCTVDGPGAGGYARTYKPPVTPPSPATNASDPVKSEAPVFLRSTNGSGVEIDVSALALPAGITLISKDFSGLPTEAAGKTWTLSHKLAGTNGCFHGKDYLALYDFTLTDETGKPITGYLGRVTVRLPVPSASKDNLHVLYYDESSKQFTEIRSVPDDQFLTYTTTHFSSYLITGNGAAGEKPAIPETGATSFPFAAAGVVLVLTLLVGYIVRKKIKD